MFTSVTKGATGWVVLLAVNPIMTLIQWIQPKLGLKRLLLPVPVTVSFRSEKHRKTQTKSRKSEWKNNSSNLLKLEAVHSWHPSLAVESTLRAGTWRPEPVLFFRKVFLSQPKKFTAPRLPCPSEVKLLYCWLQVDFRCFSFHNLLQPSFVFFLRSFCLL